MNKLSIFSGTHKFIKIFILSAVLVCFVYIIFMLWIPIKDVLCSVPYFIKIKPNIIGKNEFNIDIELPCNRIYMRELGFIIDPPVPIDRISDAYNAIAGSVDLVINQDEKIKSEYIDLSDAGRSINEIGIWTQVIYRFKPLDSILCDRQNLSIHVYDLNVNLYKHNIEFYVS